MVERVRVKKPKVFIDYPTEEEFFAKEEQSVSKYEAFRTWCKNHGVVGLDRVSYPHRFNAETDEQG